MTESEKNTAETKDNSTLDFYFKGSERFLYNLWGSYKRRILTGNIYVNSLLTGVVGTTLYYLSPSFEGKEYLPETLALSSFTLFLAWKCAQSLQK